MFTNYSIKTIKEFNKPIVIVGLMGVGKTSVGKLLAKKLSIPFIDSDREIENVSSCSIVELFSLYGETRFRKMEEQVIKRLIDTHKELFILSTGEGGYLAKSTRDYLKENAITVWINAPMDLLLQRAKFKSTRPLLLDKDPKEILQKLVHEREAIYKQADVHIITHNESIYKTINTLLQKLSTFNSKEKTSN
ncbi:MAG: shikimate kinase [Rickettsiales bacterium]|jgi:shikimate kinase|nr:shikimate kinase [Rickettsiales bacterium]